MLRPIFAFLFLVGLVSNASPVTAAVEAVVSGSGTADGALVALATESSPLSVQSGASEMVPEEPESHSQVGIDPYQTLAVPSFMAAAPSSNEPVLDNGESGETSVQVVTATASEPSDPDKRFALIPMAGASGWLGNWNRHITNPYSVGLVLEAPITRNFSLEVEGSYARYGISYSLYAHNFDLYGIGGNGKIYLTRGVFNPYVGGGIMGLYFDGMSRGPSLPYQSYNHWLGSGQLMAGGDIALSRDVSIGMRGAYVRPLFNQPATYHNGFSPNPGYEETAAINSAFFRVMGAVRVAL